MMRVTVSLFALVLFASLGACGQTDNKKHQVMQPGEKTKIVIGIIGSGNVGGTLGKKWAKAGYTVLFSSRHPEELSGLVKQAGSNTSAVTVAEAARQGTIIVLVIPFEAEAAVSKQIQTYVKNKIVILCDNAYPGRDGDVAREAKKIGVASYARQYYYPEVKLVRAFSSLPVSQVGSATAAYPVTIPYALDDDTWKPLIEQLITDVDGNPKYIGKIDDSKSLDY